jgi:hypothetical protein
MVGENSQKGAPAMKLINDTGNKNIKEIIATYPMIGEILAKHEIACGRCTVGTCLLQDVVAVHYLGDEIEAQIELEINAYLASI